MLELEAVKKLVPKGQKVYGVLNQYTSEDFLPFINKGYTLKQLGKQFNVSDTAMYSRLQKLGLKTLYRRGGKTGDRKEYLCKECGTTDPEKFFPKKKCMCAKCRNKLGAKRESDKRIKWVELKGNKCLICGYNKYIGSLDFHHLDPSIKEHSSKRNWKKTEKGMENCILVCSNCHREIHAGLHPEYLIKGE